VSDYYTNYSVLVHFAGETPTSSLFATKEAALDFVKCELDLDTLPEPWDGENGDGYGEEGVDTLEVSEVKPVSPLAVCTVLVEREDDDGSASVHAFRTESEAVGFAQTVTGSAVPAPGFTETGPVFVGGDPEAETAVFATVQTHTL
jgi:hypothetical protein